MQNLLVSIFLLILAGTVVFVEITPARLDTQYRQKQKTAMNILLKEMRGLAEMESELKKEYANIPETELLKLKEVAPPEKNLTDYVAKIATLAEEAGVGITTLSFGAGGITPGTGAFGATSITMRIEGSYDSLRFFLKEIERFVRITDITNLYFNVPPKGSGLQITVTGKFYHLLSQ